MGAQINLSSSKGRNEILLAVFVSFLTFNTLGTCCICNVLFYVLSYFKILQNKNHRQLSASNERDKGTWKHDGQNVFQVKSEGPSLEFCYTYGTDKRVSMQVYFEPNKHYLCHMILLLFHLTWLCPVQAYCFGKQQYIWKFGLNICIPWLSYWFYILNLELVRNDNNQNELNWKLPSVYCYWIKYYFSLFMMCAWVEHNA